MLLSPLGHHILSCEPPRGFAIPPFAMYDGSLDPYDHMLHFNQTMILNAGNGRLLCKVFLVSLKGPALAWFHKLPRGSINSFNKLWAAFVSQYLCLVRKKGNISSLQTLFKWEDESIRDFTRRFGQAIPTNRCIQHGRGPPKLSKKLRTDYAFLPYHWTLLSRWKNCTDGWTNTLRWKTISGQPSR